MILTLDYGNENFTEAYASSVSNKKKTGYKSNNAAVKVKFKFNLTNKPNFTLKLN